MKKEEYHKKRCRRPRSNIKPSDNRADIKHLNLKVIPQARCYLLLNQTCSTFDVPHWYKYNRSSVLLSSLRIVFVEILSPFLVKTRKPPISCPGLASLCIFQELSRKRKVDVRLYVRTARAALSLVLCSSLACLCSKTATCSIFFHAITITETFKLHRFAPCLCLVLPVLLLMVQNRCYLVSSHSAHKTILTFCKSCCQHKKHLLCENIL